MYRALETRQKECEYWPKSKEKIVASFSFDLAVTPLMKHPDDWRNDKFSALARGYVVTVHSDGVYTPACASCPVSKKCISTRIDFSKFKMTKSQQKKHDTFLKIAVIEITTPDIDSDIYDLYQKYIKFRHADTKTGMENYSIEGFKRRFSSPLLMITARDQSGGLISVHFFDQHEENFNAEYSIYDPEKAKLSPGLSMTLISASMMSKKFPNGHLYMGSWSSGSPKLGYKSQFVGMEYYKDGQWTASDNFHQAISIAPEPSA